MSLKNVSAWMSSSSCGAEEPKEKPASACGSGCGAVETFSSDFGQEILERWDLPKGYKGYLHIVFGYHKTDNPSPKPRKEGRVKFL